MSHSTKSKSTSVEKKTVVNLINGYAESYQLKEKENWRLQKKIADLEVCLNINKKIIDEIINNSNLDDKAKTCINLLRAENVELSKQLKCLEKSLEDSSIKVNKLKILLFRSLSLKVE